jgi:hypothetical protein
VDDVQRHFVAVRDLEGPVSCEVIDASRAVPAFGVRDLRRLAEDGRMMLAAAPMAPRAVIVSRELSHYALAKLFATFAVSWVSMRVFDSAPAALAYIEAVIANGT